jgi:hypothetical protein
LRREVYFFISQKSIPNIFHFATSIPSILILKLLFPVFFIFETSVSNIFHFATSILSILIFKLLFQVFFILQLLFPMSFVLMSNEQATPRYEHKNT